MDPDGDADEAGESPAEEAAESPAEEAAEEATEHEPIHMVLGGGLILRNDRHRNLFDHKKRHKEKHGY